MNLPSPIYRPTWLTWPRPLPLKNTASPGLSSLRLTVAAVERCIAAVVRGMWVLASVLNRLTRKLLQSNPCSAEVPPHLYGVPSSAWARSTTFATEDDGTPCSEEPNVDWDFRLAEADEMTQERLKRIKKKNDLNMTNIAVVLRRRKS